MTNKKNIVVFLSWVIIQILGVAACYAAASEAITLTVCVDNQLQINSTIEIEEGDFTNRTTVTLKLFAEGVSKMRFSDGNITWSEPEDYNATKLLPLTEGEGEKIVYVQFADCWGNWSQPISDRVILDTTVPSITEVNPGDGAVFYENDTILISPIVRDADSSPLEYQFSIDGVIKQSWSNLSSYSWAASLQNTGSHNIKIEAKDVGGQDNKQVEIYIFRKPILPSN